MSEDRPMILDLAHGIHLGIPAEVYYRPVLGLVNASSLKYVSRSLAHYRAALANDAPAANAAALELGTATHSALLEPEAFDREYVIAPDFGDCRFRENKARKAAWLAENAGKKPLAPEDFAAIRGMSAAVRAHPEVAPLLARAQTEVTIRWQDPTTGLECKGRVDGFVEAAGVRLVFDLKTTDDASPFAFGRSCASYSYHVQAAFYEAGFAALGRPLDAFLFVAVEKAAPYASAVYQLSPRAEAKGRKIVARSMATLLAAFEADSWPAYPQQITELDLPAWA
jgi:hypothetical protein